MIKRAATAREGSASPSASSAATSFEAYNAAFRVLADRPDELEDLVRAISGRQVEWYGFVVSAHSSAHGGVSVLFRPNPDADDLDAKACATFSSRWKTTLSTLGQGDRIRVRGVAGGGVAPFSIDGDTVELLEPGPDSA